MVSLRRQRRDQSGARPRGGRFGTDPRRRREDEPTHVDAVLEAYSDQGSIPCASITGVIQTGPSSRVAPFVCVGLRRSRRPRLTVDADAVWAHLWAQSAGRTRRRATKAVRIICSMLYG